MEIRVFIELEQLSIHVSSKLQVTQAPQHFKIDLYFCEELYKALPLVKNGIKRVKPIKSLFPFFLELFKYIHSFNVHSFVTHCVKDLLDKCYLYKTKCCSFMITVMERCAICKLMSSLSKSMNFNKRCFWRIHYLLVTFHTSLY